jgi:hypothetical protein
MGDTMDLVNGARRVIVLMEHTTRQGSRKLVKVCDLPLTGKRVVSRVITDLAVLDVGGDGSIWSTWPRGCPSETSQRRQMRLSSPSPHHGVPAPGAGSRWAHPDPEAG